MLDCCLLTLSGVTHGAPQMLYPYALFHLIRPAISAELLLSKQAKLMEAIRAGAGNLEGCHGDGGTTNGCCLLCDDVNVLIWV